MTRTFIRQLFWAQFVAAGLFAGWFERPIEAQTIFPLVAPDEPSAAAHPFDLALLADRPVDRPVEQGTPELTKDPADGKPCFVVRTRQAGLRIDEPAFVTPESRLTWSWKKEKGTVCIVQVGVRNPVTGQHRYLGYAAGAWSEPPAPDPTVEVFLTTQLPQQWTANERPLADDIRKVLGWSEAQITSFFVSPWDGSPGLFRQAVIRHVTAAGRTAAGNDRRLAFLSRAGRGAHVPLRLNRLEDQRVERFETSFEECAPGRNSGANEWSAFGAIGNLDMNCMGRELWVRYPAFDLSFRLHDGSKEIHPGYLDTFRLGLVDSRLPAIWGGWQHAGLLYKVSVMTIPSPECGNFDLYKLEIQNPASEAIESKLAAVVDGPPDLRLAEGVVRGLGESAFAVADSPAHHEVSLRSWGLCDKRAKAYGAAGGPGRTEPAIARYRVGLDGLPVVYRAKVEAAKKYVVYLAATPHISGRLLAKPEKVGDLVFEYRVEGSPPQQVDWIDWARTKNSPICVGFAGAHDTDGDGYLEFVAGVAPVSRIKHTRLSAICVFPEGTRPDNLEAVYSGSMNDRCVWHIDVGATPEQDPANQHHDKSDLPLARLAMHYGERIAAGEKKTYWLRVPPIRRRQPVSMGYMAHAFREVSPGEAVPPFAPDRVRALKQLDPLAAEKQLTTFWEGFFSRAAKFDVPDRVLPNIFLSRLATRAILDVNLNDELSYNACSPFFYFDHAYRDHAYVVYALDLAGLHDRAEKLLRVYCRDVKDVPAGPIAFDGRPLQLGMLESGLWNTRPGQWDTQGQNIWALVQHYKLSGDRQWLEKTAYPYVKRGAMWLVNSRRKHMAEVKDAQDPRYGLLEPGAMEVMEVGKGSHLYYLSAFGVLGLREAADAAKSLGLAADAKLFSDEARDLKNSLRRSFAQTFKRLGLYEGHLWFGVEPQGVGMYGFWAHNCLLWPCRAIDAHDPLLEATWRRMDLMSQQWGGGMFSAGQGSFWPYIGVDRAVSEIVRGQPERALDYFCALTDTAGGTLSWGEGYANFLAGGDQPHMWADAQWINLFRQLFAFEDDSTLWITPALFRRWHQGRQEVTVAGLPTHFGALDLRIRPQPDGSAIHYHVRITPRGDQGNRTLDRIILHPRIAGGRSITRVTLEGQPVRQFTRDRVVLAAPQRGREMGIVVEAEP